MPALADTIYQENFDGLALGQTQPYPGVVGQGGWYSVLAQSGGYGEIQSTIANSGNALHEFTAATTPPSLQTIDACNLNGDDANVLPIVTLSVDFYAHTSNLSAVNNFSADIEVADTALDQIMAWGWGPAMGRRRTSPA
jgi:hypothetical protein